jgi:hypothetical protein
MTTWITYPFNHYQCSVSETYLLTYTNHHETTTYNCYTSVAIPTNTRLIMLRFRSFLSTGCRQVVDRLSTSRIPGVSYKLLIL